MCVTINMIIVKAKGPRSVQQIGKINMILAKAGDEQSVQQKEKLYPNLCIRNKKNIIVTNSESQCGVYWKEPKI